jgi:hypothetical protein
VLIVTILFASISLSHADVPPASFNTAQLGAIREAQIRVSENRNAAHDGDLTSAAAEARIARIMAQLKTGLSTGLSEATLLAMDIPNDFHGMTTEKRAESFFAGVNFLRLGLIAVFTILAMLLTGRHLLMIVRHLPKEIWEFTVYTAGIALLAAQAGGFMGINQFWAFFGCLLIGGGLGLTFVIHQDYLNLDITSLEQKIIPGKIYLQFVCPIVMLAAFGIATLVTKSAWMGAFAALSLMTLLGFAGEVIPFGYAVGFRDDDALARATPAGLIIMVLFMGLHAGNVTNSHLRAFEPGALIVGGFVGYLGLLIAGSNWYKKRQNWILMQAIVLAICFAGVISASILGLTSVQIIAGVFLTLWTIEKMVEIPGRGFVPWVLKLMAASGVLYLIVTYGAPSYARYFIS